MCQLSCPSGYGMGQRKTGQQSFYCTSNKFAPALKCLSHAASPKHRLHANQSHPEDHQRADLPTSPLIVFWHTNLRGVGGDFVLFRQARRRGALNTTVSRTVGAYLTRGQTLGSPSRLRTSIVSKRNNISPTIPLNVSIEAGETPIYSFFSCRTDSRGPTPPVCAVISADQTPV